MSSSLPQFYADYTFSGETSSQFRGSSSCPDISALSTNYFDDGYASFNNTSSNQESIFLPQVLGLSDVSLPEFNIYNHHMSGANNATPYFHGGDQEYYGRFSPDIKPFLPSATREQPWHGTSEGVIQGEQNIKVGRYTVEERKDRIMRYLKKKNQRNFNKTIKYVCRKTLADRRVRVHGRFARNNDTCDQQQQSPMSKNHSNHSEKEDDISDEYLFQMENDEGWLHEAMSNLISFPCELDSLGDAHHPNTWSF